MMVRTREYESGSVQTKDLGDVVEVWDGRLGVHLSVGYNYGPRICIRALFSDALFRDSRVGRVVYVDSPEDAYAVDEVTLDATGVLTAMRRVVPELPGFVRRGLTVQLPPEFVEPVRQALATVSQRVAAARQRDAAQG